MLPPIDLIVIGKLKNTDPLYAVFEDYRKRMVSRFTLYELDAPTTPAQHQKILEKINPQGALVVLDERGQSLGSRDFAAKLSDLHAQGAPILQFIIGGADGLSEELRKKAALMLSFGKQTWPHMMARVMVMEQIYRAQQILAGHPYHRD